MGLPEAGSQYISPHEIAELPGSGVVPPVPSGARNSSVVQRKPVAGSQYSPPNQAFSFTDFEGYGQSPTTAQDAPDRVVSDVSFVSGENTRPAESNGRGLVNPGAN
ncbi:hypothetical protein NQ176_g10733 [Zarea fungicola]|uniref:Uncharacterized protein n=1 Tax=Zarea fungicola TaxID=93591 RepID=A0ACC1MDT2_9HYPO|nr:hypothetical protein NQ176_g10733 [Lecanicillium fungicola]